MNAGALVALLHDVPVGTLYRDGVGRYGFRFFESYRANPRRPVLSEWYVQSNYADDPPARLLLPPYFENLVPEGQLRRLLGARGEGPHADFAILASIGPDLPGALRLVGVEGEPFAEPGGDRLADAPPSPTGPLRFSLAGMQLKASVDLRGGKVVAPVHGEPGHFIVKFQDPQFREVPQVEHAIMSWARASGLRVADTRLVDPGDIDELPLLGRYEGEPALLVRRFDRAEGRRVHAEEFNQVFGLRVEERYQRRGWKHHLAMLNQVCPEDVAEYLRRLLFMILSGHSDAHHKNWGLYYPEGVPRLSPAYDLLCVRAWAGEPGAPDDRLPFALGSHDKRWERLEWDGFLRLPGEAKVHTFVDGARRVGPADLGDWAAEELRRQAARVDVALDLGPPRLARGLAEHRARVPMLRQLGVS